MKKVIIATLLILVAFILLNNTNANQTIEYEEYIVQPNDTFWGIYSERYSDKNYSKALYDFKKDNDMQVYDLKVGQVVKLRK